MSPARAGTGTALSGARLSIVQPLWCSSNLRQHEPNTGTFKGRMHEWRRWHVTAAWWMIWVCHVGKQLR